MNGKTYPRRRLEQLLAAAFATAAMMLSSPAHAGNLGIQLNPPAERFALAPQAAAPWLAQSRPQSAPLPALPSEPSRIAPALSLSVGKSTLLRLPDPVDRVSVANPAIADVRVISQKELYVLGKDLGTTNIIVWAKQGPATVVDVSVGAEPAQLQTELQSMLPEEKGIQVRMSADSVVLMGTVSNAVAASQAVDLAEAWVRRLTRGLVLPVQSGDGKGGTTIQVGQTQNLGQAARIAGPRVINMLQITDPMQVMLEVKVAEVSKTLLDRLGFTVSQIANSGNTTFSLLSQSNFFGQLLGIAAARRPNGEGIQVDAQRDDALVKILAEPNIMAISGQEASFRAGGRIFIPVARENNLTGGSTVTLEEKEFGVGVKFKPTVLAAGRINLKVAPEVSDLNQNGSPFTTVGGTTSILPSFTLRRAETTVQLSDGQSFMIAGLLRNDMNEAIDRFPGLGDIPVLGALFRSSQFQTSRSELMFVITPHLVKPLPANYALPTDAVAPPSSAEFFGEGKLEGKPANTPAAARPPATAPGGFQVR